MKALILSLVVSLLSVVASQAADTDYSTVPLATLVDDLTQVDSPTPGLDGMAWFSVFMADDRSPTFEGGVLGTPTPTVPPQMRELVRRGLAALPLLIQHLDDARPTKLTVGGDFFMWGDFSSEYDDRLHSAPRSRCANELCSVKPFGGRYVVRVGDVCYVLVGQIVDRNLNAVRYQPTGGIIVNSPLEAPTLIDLIKKDWGGLDAGDHEASLLNDLHAGARPSQFEPALARLRVYYPQAYVALSVRDIEKRATFEADEKTHPAPN